MFFEMIRKARDQWYASSDCTIKDLIEYIIHTQQMRDAQIEAIKTYLYLKIGCDNQPLPRLFSSGAFSTLDLDAAELSSSVRTFLSTLPAAAALYEYATQRNDSGEQVSTALAKQIRSNPEAIDYQEFFCKAFYGVSYTDYLFSLPMGAGKTYLMAAFIYLDLYFAMNEPKNSAFAHNFIIFAPSGLKSSVVPSLRTIQNFDPAWIIPEPAASAIKRNVIFEVLDESKSASKSNKTKNPNVQKIAIHQPISELWGLIAVTNAEKVILDRIQEKNGQISFLEESNNDKDRQANELRNLIGKLPALSIFIDEVHHAVSNEIKLRAVVNKWMKNHTLNSVIGFSGTPYLDKAEKLVVTEQLSVSTSEISNIVYYYPLIKGIGNFLKRPVVKIVDRAPSEQIIEAGVREFFHCYKDMLYSGGLIPKLGIYCGTIEKLEELVYPLVSRLCIEYGLSTASILKFHKGNKQHPQPEDSQLQFDILDKSISAIRIVLLVQIGKEGWDCKSLTGIILSQEGDCPKNMVLQTSCRCLRQVEKGKPETALIYLNDDNAKKLNAQLEQYEHISLNEFRSADNKPLTIHRYDRTAYLQLPKVLYYQLKVKFETLVVDDALHPEAQIATSTQNAEREKTIIRTTDIGMNVLSTQVLDHEYGDIPASFYAWLYGIAKSSLGFVAMEHLRMHGAVLKSVFDTITYENLGLCYFSSQYNRGIVEAAIRKAFYQRRSFITKEELIPQEANLLNIVNFTREVNTLEPDAYYPDQPVVENIIRDDSGDMVISPDVMQAIHLLEQTGNTEIANSLRNQQVSHPQKDRSFHYLPYRTDSSFEQTFLEEVLTYPELDQFNLEVYYNGDRALTEFKINCYKARGNQWQYIGVYTPDFLIIQRRGGQIFKAIIAETKGAIYANDPTFQEKRLFMDTAFKEKNNEAFGYARFEYLYLEDSLPEAQRLQLTHDKICSFFKEDEV